LQVNPHANPKKQKLWKMYEEKGKVLGTGIIKVNNKFTMKGVALVDNLRYNLLFVSQLLMLIWMFFFTNLVIKFLILVVILFVVFLTLGRFFKLIFHLLNPL
jgi:predicted RND superfamily exporter protein